MNKNDLDLYKQFVKTTFKMRYKGSILGFFWVLLKPFFMFLILFLIFSHTASAVGGLTQQQYAVYLLSGLIVYTFFNEGMIWGMGSIMERAQLIVKINFKRDVVVASSLSMALINFSINLLIVLVVALILKINISLIGLAYVFLIGLTMFLSLYGVSFFTSIWLVHVRDLQHIMELVLQLLFYASAVFFPVEMIPEKYRFIVYYNPMARFVKAVREALIFGEVTDLKFVILALAVSIVLVILGKIYFNKHIKKVAEHF
ncbi:TPA: ABC transporter permease [Candidatus Dojkabacteria bacterium]|uniref:Transport permease protein n=1 Tax=Candidatus Dojkabacteria bacterium TaxID=2099670 RepID=A0A832QEY1_9BACT|nr:ABC transporter permease [Candidatus Dojkabacteria bacterium]